MRTTTAQTLDIAASKAPVAADRADFLVGLALTAFVPAFFWVALFAGIASFIGYTPDLGALLIAGVAIATFLGAFFAVLTGRPN